MIANQQYNDQVPLGVDQRLNEMDVINFQNAQSENTSNRSKREERTLQLDTKQKNMDYFATNSPDRYTSFLNDSLSAQIKMLSV